MTNNTWTRTTNGNIATKRFPEQHVKVISKNNFAILEQKHTLQALEVVFDGEGYKPGDVVYVLADSYNHVWAKNSFTLDEIEFILVPKDMVRMCRISSESKIS